VADRLGAVYRPFQHHFRSRRMRRVGEGLDLTPGSRVLDVGGTPSIWRESPIRPNITFVNLRVPRQRIPNGMSFVQADGRRLPFKDGSFDLVFCNSVIEHLGSKEAQQALAAEIVRVGGSYYVQTPNRWFPVEPHLLTPLIHYLPKAWQEKLMRNFSLRGVLNRPTRQRCAEWVRTIRLLDSAEATTMFPDGALERERFLGLTKSLVITRADGDSRSRAHVHAESRPSRSA
jgi:SAM-dependent methyltransferase